MTAAGGVAGGQRGVEGLLEAVDVGDQRVGAGLRRRAATAGAGGASASEVARRRHAGQLGDGQRRAGGDAPTSDPGGGR